MQLVFHISYYNILCIVIKSSAIYSSLHIYQVPPSYIFYFGPLLLITFASFFHAFNNTGLRILPVEGDHFLITRVVTLGFVREEILGSACCVWQETYIVTINATLFFAVFRFSDFQQRDFIFLKKSKLFLHIMLVIGHVVWCNLVSTNSILEIAFFPVSSLCVSLYFAYIKFTLCHCLCIKRIEVKFSYKIELKRSSITLKNTHCHKEWKNTERYTSRIVDIFAWPWNIWGGCTVNTSKQQKMVAFA